MTEQNDESKAVRISVTSKDAPSNEKDKSIAGKQKKRKQDQEELSEESKKVQADMDLLAARLQDPDEGVSRLALETLSIQLQGATSTITSVPLPLKFLLPHFNETELFWQGLPDSHSNKKPLADVLSILATAIPNVTRKALRYRLAGTREGLTSWGQGYLRNISGELVAEFEERQSKAFDATSTEFVEANTTELIELVRQIVPFYMKHHNEIDAVDLLNEVQRINEIVEYVDGNNYRRICEYMLALSSYAASSEDSANLLIVAGDIYLKQGEYAQAVRVALKLNDVQRVVKIVGLCENKTMRKQIGFFLGLMQFSLPEDLDDDDDLGLASNERLSDMYKLLAKELDVLDPKLPEDIFKTHLDDRRPNGFLLDSFKMNLASTLVSAFVNAGFGTDGLLTPPDSTWIFKNREHSIMSAAASLGAVMAWNVEDGLTAVDKLRWSDDRHVKAGAFYAFGLICSSIRSACDPAFGLLSDKLEVADALEREGALLGVAAAHIGWRREELLDLLVPFVIDTSLTNELSALAALTLGLSFLGTGDEHAAEAILQTLIERQTMPGNLDGPLSYCFALGLAFLFYGQRDACEATGEALQAVSGHPIGAFASVVLEGCAHAGSGDVTKVQRFLQLCSEKLEEPSEEKGEGKQTEDGETEISPYYGMHQAMAALSMALVGLSEQCGTEMQFRLIDHLLQYGNVRIRRAVPLALALLSTSNPKPQVVDSLSKLSHDPDTQVGMNAVLALGIVGAGTNNAKIGDLLRRLASSYYARNLDGLFCVRVSQGLLYMGKGLLTISPVVSDGFLLSPVPLVSLLTILTSCLFLKTTFLGRFHSLLFLLIPAMRPRMLMTLDEELNLLPVTVRVGQAVDTAGQAGHPRSITGFQTHTTPVLLNAGDRAELATQEYQAVANIPLEGLIILQKNPHFVDTAK